MGTSFAVLSDSSKRKRYDTYGPEMEAPSRRSYRDQDNSHGFEGSVLAHVEYKHIIQSSLHVFIL